VQLWKRILVLRLTRFAISFSTGGYTVDRSPQQFRANGGGGSDCTLKAHALGDAMPLMALAKVLDWLGDMLAACNGQSRQKLWYIWG
jgi:hypothetical protein